MSGRASAAGPKRIRLIPKEAPPKRPFYRPVEACSILNIAMATLYRRMADGDIRTIKLGGARLISQEEIDRVTKPS